MSIASRESDFRMASKRRKQSKLYFGKRRVKGNSSRMEAQWYSKLYGAALKCKVCSEKRAVELCHIIPVKSNGSGSPFNLLCLCPTHHKLFDDGKLSESEFESVRDKFHLALKYWSLNERYAMAA